MFGIIRPMERRSDIRLNIIFKGLEEGESVDEIRKTLSQESKDYYRSLQRGLNSEMRTMTALLKLPEVIKIIPSKDKSQLDRQSIDLRVRVQSETSPRFYTVLVQVKSSRAGMDKFYFRIMGNLGTNSIEEVFKWLHFRKMMVINGQESDSQIADSFRYQLKKINQNNF